MEYLYTADVHAACSVHADGHSVAHTSTDRTAWFCGLNDMDTLRDNGNPGTAVFMYADVVIPLEGVQVLAALSCLDFDVVFGEKTSEQLRDILRRTSAGFAEATKDLL